MMKNIYLLLTALLCCSHAFQSTAQTPAFYNFNSAGSTNTFPFNTVTGKAVQWLVAPGEFTSAANGNITAIYFRISAVGTGTSWNNLTIKMGQTQATNLNPTIWLTGLSTVFTSVSQPITAVNGSWMSFTLQTPFYYDASQSLIIEVSQSSVTGGTGPQQGNTTIANSIRRVFANIPGAPLGGDGVIGHIGVDIVAASPCAIPVAGTAIVTSATPCLGVSIGLNLTGNTVGPGQTYHLDTSANITGPFTPVGTPHPIAKIFTTPTGTAYYRTAVTCGTATDYSAPVLVTVAPPFAGGTYTINPALPASSTNFQTFAAAAAAINCAISGPVVLNVASGTYTNDNFYLDSTNGTSLGNNITLNGNGATLAYTSTDGNNRAVVRLNGTDHVTINNLNIIATGSTNTEYGFGVQLLNNADSNTIANCSITVDTVSTLTNFTPVVVSGSVSAATTPGSNSDGNTFTGNTLNGGYYGLVIYGNSAVPYISNYTITNNTIKNFYSYGIYVYGTDGALIEGNDVSRPTRTSSTTFAGIIFSGPTQNINFNKNRIHNPFDAMPLNASAAYPIFCSASDATAGNENIISNNLVYNINNFGPIYGIYNSGSDYYKAFHNSISLDDVTTKTSADTRGIYQTTQAIGLEFKNNIVSVTRSGYGINHGIYLGTTTTVGVMNNNNYYVSGSGTNYVGFLVASQSTLTNWQTTTGQDLNSFALCPFFSGIASGNLTPGNPLLDNVGAPVGVPTDVNNVARSATTPDMGAYEFTVPACTGPVGGTALINGVIPTAAVCIGGKVVLTSQGYSVGTGTTYQWESSPTGQNTWTPIAGATNSNYNTTFSAPMDYRLIVTCGTSSISTIVSTTQESFYRCYCSPLTGNVLHTTTANNTTNVTISSTSLNNTTPVVGSGGYTFSDPSVSTSTAQLLQGVSYTLSATQSSATANSEAWIDWNHSGTFDASEYFALTKTGLISSVNITPPLSALTGLTGLRVRTILSATALFGPTGACANPTTGRETEDYVIDILPVPTCLPPSGLTAGSSTTSSVTVNWAASTSNPALGYDYYYNTTNIAPVASTPPLGNVGQGSSTATITGLNSGTPYYVWIRSRCAANDQSIWIGPATIITLITNDEAAGAIPIPVNPDYNCGAVTTGTTIGATQSVDPAPSCNATGINDDVWFSFTATNTAHRVTIYGMTQIVGVALYSGTIGSLTQVTGACAASTIATTATNLYATGLTIGTVYYARVYTTVPTAGTPSNFTICVGTLSVTPPINDPCTNAIDITSSMVTPGTMAAATQTLAPCDATVSATDVWYSFTTGNAAGSVTVSAVTTYADIVMQAFSGTCGALTGIIPTASTTANGSCIDGPAIGTEFGTYTVAPNTTYYVRIYGYGMDQGTFTIQAVGTPLSIKLGEITATNIGTRNRIDWFTGTEASTDRFELEAGADGKTFRRMATMNAIGQPSSYSYWDESPVPGINYYRLKIIDAAGAFTYSEIVTATVIPNGIFSMQAYPNPVTSLLTINIHGAVGPNATLEIADLTGKVVMMMEAANTTEINMVSMAAGIYLIKYTDANSTHTIKVNKQ